jgi:hypothetical protein
MTKPTLCTFWAGHAGPYQTLCIASWVAHGHDVVVYTADTDIRLPRGARQRPAEDILDLGRPHSSLQEWLRRRQPIAPFQSFPLPAGGAGRLVARHRHGHAAGRPARNGLLSGTAGQQGQSRHRRHAPAGAIAGDPRRDPEIEAVIDKAEWGQTGPDLITRLVEKYGLTHKAYDRRTAYEIDYTEAIKLFDPDARDEVEERVASSLFVHLWNEVWNAIGFPQDLGPPEGSYLDGLVERFGSHGMFPARVPFASVRTWWDNREQRTRLWREPEGSPVSGCAVAQLQLQLFIPDRDIGRVSRLNNKAAPNMFDAAHCSKVSLYRSAVPCRRGRRARRRSAERPRRTTAAAGPGRRRTAPVPSSAPD